MRLQEEVANSGQAGNSGQTDSRPELSVSRDFLAPAPLRLPGFQNFRLRLRSPIFIFLAPVPGYPRYFLK